MYNLIVSTRVHSLTIQLHSLLHWLSRCECCTLFELCSYSPIEFHQTSLKEYILAFVVLRF